MEQLLEEINSKKTSDLLIEYLIEQKLIKEDVIKKLINEKDKAVSLAKKEINSLCYAINHQKRSLQIFDTHTNTIKKEINLPTSSKNNALDPNEIFEAWGDSISIMDTTDIQKIYDIPFNKNSIYGIAFYNNKPYIYNSDLENHSYIPITSKFIFGANAKNKNTSLPYDIFFSKNKEIICLSNRDEGKVHIFSTKEEKFIKEIVIRNSGNSKAINIAISDKNKKIYFTDYQTPIITSYDITTGDLNKKSLTNLGILGNICLSPDEKSLFTIITKPNPALKVINIETFEEIKEFPHKGDFFSSADAPCDLLELTPDNNNLFYMTYLNEPKPFTPVITVIDLEKNKTIKRFSIKDEVKPISIAFKEDNPVKLVNKSIEELLVENGNFTFNKIREFKLKILKELSEKETKNKALDEYKQLTPNQNVEFNKKEKKVAKKEDKDKTETLTNQKLDTQSSKKDNFRSTQIKGSIEESIKINNIKLPNIAIKSLKKTLQNIIKNIQNSVSSFQLERFASPTREKNNTVLGRGAVKLNEAEKNLIVEEMSKWESTDEVNEANAAVVLSWAENFINSDLKGNKK